MHGMSAGAILLLTRYRWSGSIPELENVIWRALMLETTCVLQAGNSRRSRRPSTRAGAIAEHQHVPRRCVASPLLHSATPLRAATLRPRAVIPNAHNPGYRPNRNHPTLPAPSTPVAGCNVPMPGVEAVGTPSRTECRGSQHRIANRHDSCCYRCRQSCERDDWL